MNVLIRTFDTRLISVFFLTLSGISLGPFKLGIFAEKRPKLELIHKRKMLQGLFLCNFKEINLIIQEM